MRLVVQDHAHIGLALSPPPEEHTQVIASRKQPLCAIVWPGHPLADADETPSLTQAMAYSHGLMSQGFGLRQLVQLAAFAENISVNPSFTSNSIAVLKRYVQARAGITFLPISAVAAESAAGTLVALPMRNAVMAHAEARLIVRRGRPLSFAAQQLIASIRQLGLFTDA